jgi:hypothetical protein
MCGVLWSGARACSIEALRLGEKTRVDLRDTSGGSTPVATNRNAGGLP